MSKVCFGTTTSLNNRNGTLAFVDTTIDINIQEQLERIVKKYVTSKTTKGISNASVLLLNYQTMSIEAMVGSADFNNQSISAK